MKHLITLSFLVFTYLCNSQSLTDSLIVCMPMDNNTSDFSGHGNNGTIVGSLTLVPGHNGTPNSAYRFAPNNYINIPPSASTNRIEQFDELSISIWCRVNQWSPTNHAFPMVEKQDPVANDGWSFILYEGNYVNPASPNNMGFINTVSAAATKWDYGAVAAISVGTNSAWNHYAMVYSQSGNFCKLYVNGSLIGTRTPLTTNALFNVVNGSIIIGYSPIGAPEWSYGDIDDLRIYDRPLSNSEISLLYSRNFNCTATGLSTDISTTSEVRADVLAQNAPNPFVDETMISYAIPSKFKKAQIIFTTIYGSIIKTIDINESGEGTTTVFASDLNTKMCFYTLVVDGKSVAIRKLLRE